MSFFVPEKSKIQCYKQALVNNLWNYVNTCVRLSSYGSVGEQVGGSHTKY